MNTLSSESRISNAGSSEVGKYFHQFTLEETAASCGTARRVYKMSKNVIPSFSSILGGIAEIGLNGLSKACAMVAIVILSAGMFPSEAFGQFDISIADGEGDEGDSGNDNTVPFVITADPQNSNFTVNWTVSIESGDSAGASDFNGSLKSGSEEFRTSDGTGSMTPNSRTINVDNIVGDLDNEGDETFTISITSTASGATFSRSSASGKIKNDDFVFVEILETDRSQSRLESTGEFNFNVVIVDAAGMEVMNGVPQPFEVDWRIASRPSILPPGFEQITLNDFRTDVIGSVQFSSGASKSPVKIEFIPKDGYADKFFNMRIYGLRGMAFTKNFVKLASNSIEVTANAEILSGKKVLVGFADASETVQVTEGDGNTPNTKRFKVTAKPREGTSSLTEKVVVNWSLQYLDTDVSDFVAVDESGSLEFLGVRDCCPAETEKFIDITIASDNNLEPNENFSLTLDSLTIDQALIGKIAIDTESNTATGIIVNDDVTPELTIASGSKVMQNMGSVTFEITSNVNIAAGGIEVHYRPTSNPAGLLTNQNAHNVSTKSMIDFKGGKSATLTIILNNGIAGRISVQLEPDGDGTNYGIPSTGTIGVVDVYVSEALPSVRIEIEDDTVVEGESTALTVSVIGNVPKEGLNVKLKVVQRGGYLAWGPPGTVQFGAAGSKTFHLPTIDNTEFQASGGSFTVSLLDSDDYELASGSMTSISVQVNDNDGGTESNTIYSVAGAVIRNILISQQSRSQKVTESRSVHLVSISAIEESVNEGKPIQFAVSITPEAEFNLPVKVSLTEYGDYINERKSFTVLFGVGENYKTYEIPTVDDDLAEDNGIVTAEVMAGRNYVIGQNPRATVIVFDENDREFRRNQLTIANEPILPQFAGSIGAGSLEAASLRATHAFNEVPENSLEIGGTSEISSILKERGESLNGNDSSWQSFFGDSSFSLDISTESEGLESSAIWGLGDYRELSGKDSNYAGKFTGELFTGQLGIDAMLDKGIVVGFATSMSNGNASYELQKDSIHYETRTVGLHPYVGLESSEGNHRIEAITGYGLGEMKLTQDRYAPEFMQSSFYNLGISGSSQLYSTSEIIASGKSEIEVSGESWIAKAFLKQGEGFMSGTMAAASHLKLDIRGSHEQELLEGSLFTPTASVGIRSDGNGSHSFKGISLKLGMNYSNPNGWTLKSESNLMIEDVDRLHAFMLNGGMDYDHGKDGKGILVGLKSDWTRFHSDWANNLWNSTLLNGTDNFNSGREGAQISSEIGYGFAVLEDLGLLNLYGGMLRSEMQDDKFRIGTKLNIGEDFEFELEGSQTLPDEDADNINFKLESSLRW